jgi:hypothetical protein
MDQNVREFLGKIAEVPQNFTLTLLLRKWLQSKEKFKTIKWSWTFWWSRFYCSGSFIASSDR